MILNGNFILTTPQFIDVDINIILARQWLIIIEAKIRNLFTLHSTHHKICIKRFFCGMSINAE